MLRALAVDVGRRARRGLAGVGRFSRFVGGTARAAANPARLNPRVLGKVLLNQVRFSGLHAAPLTAGAATMIGAVAIIQSFTFLTGLADDYIGSLLVSVIIRELGPLVTAIILIGRSGTAMATETGSMRLNGEIEALEAYRIDPAAFIVLPRLVGAVLAMLALIVVFDALGIFGGFLVALTRMDLSLALLLGRVLEALTPRDVLLSALKAVGFGSAIALLSCSFGLDVEPSPTELPKAVTKAVVASLASVLVIDGVIAFAFYL